MGDSVHRGEEAGAEGTGDVEAAHSRVLQQGEEAKGIRAQAVLEAVPGRKDISPVPGSGPELVWW